MPLWFFPALMALFALLSLASGIWLLLHLPDLARVFRGDRDGDLVPGPTKRRASPSAIWLALALFNASWIACVLIWILVIGGDANQAISSVNN